MKVPKSRVEGHAPPAPKAPPLWEEGPPVLKASDVLHFVPGPCECKWCKEKL